MLSLINIVFIALICLLTGAVAWVSKQYLDTQKEADRLKEKLQRLAKKKKQRSIKPTRPPFEQVLGLMPGGIVISDRDGKLIWYNEKASDILDLAPDEMTRNSIMSILSPLPMLISNSIGESEVAPAEFDLNGRRIQGTMFVLYGKDGLDQGSVAILNDVTTWHAALRSKQKQLDEINHELRQRLTSMGSFTEMLGETQKGKESGWLPRLHETVGRVTELIDTIMQISVVKNDGASADCVPVDVPRTIAETLEWLKPEIDASQIYIKHHIDKTMGPIIAQPVHIQTILKELLTNSIRFNRPGGMIQIKAAVQRDEDSRSEFLILNISDDGEGIPAEDQQRIFDIFYRPNAVAQSQHRNIGVGLAIVHAIVEGYNGRIWFKSQEGKGTAFTILLPTGQSVEPEENEAVSADKNEDEDEFGWIEETAY